MGINRNESSGNGVFLGIADGKITRRIEESELPAQYDTRQFRVRTGTKPDGDPYKTCEEIFDSVSGNLEDLSLVQTPFGTTQIRVKLMDGVDSFVVNIPFDNGSRLNQYGVDFIGRMLSGNPEDFLGEEVTLFPYKIEREDAAGKFNTGISVRLDGGKLKSAFAKDGRLSENLPEPVKKEARGKITWDYSGREEKIYSFAERFINSFGQLSASKTLGQAEEDAGLTEEPVTDNVVADDLPF